MSKRDNDEDGDEDHRRKKSRRDDEEPPDLHSIFNGEVSSVQKYGVFVKIPGHLKQGLVHKSQMSKSKIEDPSEMLSVGEKVYCKVISTDDNKISLSMKMVSQTTGNDLDPNNVELSLDEKRRRQFNKREREKIELGAVLNTTCRRCGGHGHFAQDCFVIKGNKSYELVPEFDENKIIPEKIPENSSTGKKKKKEKKRKKEKKKKRKSTSSSDSSDSDSNHRHKKKKSHKKEKKRKRHHSSSSGS